VKISSNNAIYIALLFALLVHGALLLGSKQDVGDLSTRQVAAVTINVALFEPVAIAQQVNETDEVVSEQIVAVPVPSTAQPLPVQNNQPKAVDQQRVDTPVEADVVSDYSDPQPQRQPQQQGQRADELRKFVYEAINRQKHYPYMARRQHREGLVKLNFVMHPNGKVTDIAIVESSRFHLLDKAAMQAVESISPFHLAAEYLTMQQHYDVGIDFRLN
jgi:TonB family protein